ncbi:MerR family DNA-binding transcriptional regulator [Streptomyces sp. NPDC059499]|uniref:MerR family DNA-binding transcriptional regulator n=1 Tax=Streptomyces sp. NPDC059499 TaxID=3346852 RepID=UPI0036BE222D
MSADLRSGQAAEAAGVNVQTLRSYEWRGLPAEPERGNGGHRLYGEEVVTALPLSVAHAAHARSLRETEADGWAAA